MLPRTDLPDVQTTASVPTRRRGLVIGAALGVGVVSAAVLLFLALGRTSSPARPPSAIGAPAAVGAVVAPPVRPSVVAPPAVPTRPLESAVDLRGRARDAATVGALDEAERLLERAVAFAAQDALAWNDLGVVRVRRGDLRGGIAAFERSLALDKGSADTHRNLAVALDRIGQTVSATLHYRAFLVLAPEHPDRSRVERRLASQ